MQEDGIPSRALDHIWTEVQCFAADRRFERLNHLRLVHCDLVVLGIARDSLDQSDFVGNAEELGDVGDSRLG